MVNAGIYIVSPDLISLVPEDEKYNMTDLIVDTRKITTKCAFLKLRTSGLI
jgi:hypothetical protein